MKKFICIAIAALTLMAAPAANAQLRFGAKVGATFSNLKWDNVQNLDFNGTTLTNFTGGVTAEWIFFKGLGIDASLMYTAKGTKYQVGDNILGEAYETISGTREAVSSTIHYLEVPINVKYKLSIPVIEDVVIPYIYTGPGFAFNIGTSFKGAGETVDQMGELIKTKAVDVAWNVGIGAEIIKHVTVAVQYGWGLGTAAEFNWSNLTDMGKAKSGSWAVTVGYMF